MGSFVNSFGIEKDLVVIYRNIWGILKGVGTYLVLCLYGGRVYL
jgi:hypothetical protein